MLKKLFSSRKFITSLAGIVVVVFHDALGFELTEEQVYAVLGIISSFVVGQGLADFGKENAKL